ncbi:MAG: alpha/beta fold hydrolase [Leptospiraceae bacterium]
MPDSSHRSEIEQALRATDSVALSYSLTRSNARAAPVVLIHGLFGSSRNWQSIAQDLSDRGPVYSIDQRNHGNSPHTETHTLYDMVADLKRWHDENLSQKAVYVGHSMGGLAVMGLALIFPELVEKLVVVDIAPRSYEPHHDLEFQALEMDVSGFKSRSEIDQAMATIHPTAAVRKFLQMNLDRDSSGYRWSINVRPLRKATYLDGFQQQFPDLVFEGPALIIKGELSDYIQDRDRELFSRYFPSSRLVELKEADHWLHYSAQKAFVQTLRMFLDA